MERSFSADDFLGTMLRNLSSSSFHGFDLESLEIGGPSEDAGNGMPRIDSVSVFQEFLKHRIPSVDPAADSETVVRPEMGKAMSRIDSLRYIQEFLKNHSSDDLSAGVEGDVDESGKDFAISQSLGLPQADSELSRCENVIEADANAANRGNAYDCSLASFSLQENHQLLAKGIEDTSNGQLSSATQRSAAADAINLGERRASGSVSPLFTGLQGDSISFNSQNPQEHEHILRQQLDLACAAVALARSRGKGGNYSSREHLKIPNPEPEVIDLECTGAERKSVGPLGIPALPPKPKVRVAFSGMARMNTSGSSREHTDDEELDLESGGNEQNLLPEDPKRLRRMLSNRESARRSRRRKQAHLAELEIQVAQLRVENSSLFKQVNEVTQKFNEALVDNRVLKADVEALRVKVRIAEEIVSRSGITQGIQASFSADMHQGQHFTGSKMGRTPSMQRVASLEHLQKRIRGGAVCNSLPWSSLDDAGCSRVRQGPITEYL